MITTKQRAFLRSIAGTTEALYQIGKNGLTENLIKTLSDALEARELIKINVLETCPESPKQIIASLCESLGCEAVQVIGRKVCVYRPSTEQPKIKLP
ncbi:MAG: ribosome assembly RNA-binding protein YhbY [Eubacteriales bacterium]|nr:ribosome assembly RNA-binding protein YhbY [Eubacteriales bacterium]MDD4422002.1 ribosome assembly RNA-binding protein YhbY [Eubacteriales bacterium]HBR32208.1 ribosome assembly RNA-binding protein YhbY [Clostridiales bacterium]